MQRDRDDNRVKQHDPQREREVEHQRDERRSSAREVRPWAHETAAWLTRPNEVEQARALPPRDLEARLQRDIDALRSIDGLKPEAWSKANADERLEIVREVEATLAATQGRAASRVYAVDWQRLQGAIAVCTEPDRPVDEVTARMSKEVTSKHAFLDAQNRMILVRADFLDSKAEWPGYDFNDVHQALNVVLEECRHGYQRASLEYPNRYSEVDAITFFLWQNGYKNYAEDLKAEDFTQYENNEIEKDAKSYAAEVVRRLRERDEDAS